MIIFWLGCPQCFECLQTLRVYFGASFTRAYSKMSETSNSYPAVATIIGCPEELTSANGLVATPIGVSGELQPPRVNQQVTAPHADDTSNIKDPIQRAVMDNIWGKLPTKTPIDKIRCDVCKVECIGKAIYTTHLNGSKHAKKLKELEIQKECASMPFVKQCKESNTYSCTLCNATLNAYSQIAAHVRGAKHQAKANSRDKLEESNAQINVHPGKPRKSKVCVDATANLLYCATCNIHVNSTQQLEQHTASRKHINRVNGNKDRPAPYYRQNLARGGRGKPNTNNGSCGYWPQQQNNYTNISENFVPSGNYNTTY